MHCGLGIVKFARIKIFVNNGFEKIMLKYFCEFAVCCLSNAMPRGYIINYIRLLTYKE